MYVWNSFDDTALILCTPGIDGPFLSPAVPKVDWSVTLAAQSYLCTRRYVGAGAWQLSREGRDALSVHMARRN